MFANKNKHFLLLIVRVVVLLVIVVMGCGLAATSLGTFVKSFFDLMNLEVERNYFAFFSPFKII